MDPGALAKMAQEAATASSADGSGDDETGGEVKSVPELHEKVAAMVASEGHDDSKEGHREHKKGHHDHKKGHHEHKKNHHDHKKKKTASAPTLAPASQEATPAPAAVALKAKDDGKESVEDAE